MKQGLIGAGALLAVAAQPAAAQQKPRTLGAIEACRAITDNTARLACFDRESAALVAATASGEVAIVDRAEMKQARRSLFGFSLPRLPFFSGDKSSEDTPDSLESTIKSAYQVEGGRYRMVIADGDALWETTETPMRLSAPRAGQKIEIRKAALGSYFLRIDGQIGVRGRRIK